MLKHIEGTSTHGLALQYNTSQSTIYRHVEQQIKKIPNINHVTETICNRFSGYLQIDGKYLSVEGREMVLIWAIDYYYHDIVWFELVTKETFPIYQSIFKRLRSAGYSLKFLICDDMQAIRNACLMTYPEAKIQICTVHLLRNIKKELNTKENEVDAKFFVDMQRLFQCKSLKHFAYTVKRILKTYRNEKYWGMIRELDQRSEFITTYLKFSRCPSTTNLIEGYNKHLETRLRKLDGFKSEVNAKLWLNSYIYYKRTSKLKHCKGKFKRLNGKVPLFETAKSNYLKSFSFTFRKINN